MPKSRSRVTKWQKWKWVFDDLQQSLTFVMAFRFLGGCINKTNVVCLSCFCALCASNSITKRMRTTVILSTYTMHKSVGRMRERDGEIGPVHRLPPQNIKSRICTKIIYVPFSRKLYLVTKSAYAHKHPKLESGTNAASHQKTNDPWRKIYLHLCCSAKTEKKNAPKQKRTNSIRVKWLPAGKTIGLGSYLEKTVYIVLAMACSHFFVSMDRVLYVYIYIYLYFFWWRFLSSVESGNANNKTRKKHSTILVKWW